MDVGILVYIIYIYISLPTNIHIYILTVLANLIKVSFASNFVNTHHFCAGPSFRLHRQDHLRK
jgi:hypothetical protein